MKDSIFMKRFSRPMIGLCSAAAALAVAVAVQFGLGAKETNTNTPPRYNLQEAPINRQAQGVSYAPVIKRVAPSVVNIFSTHTIRERANEWNPLDDPMFRRFFGPNGGDDGSGDGATPPRRG